MSQRERPRSWPMLSSRLVNCVPLRESPPPPSRTFATCTRWCPWCPSVTESEKRAGSGLSLHRLVAGPHDSAPPAKTSVHREPPHPPASAFTCSMSAPPPSSSLHNSSLGDFVKPLFTLVLNPGNFSEH